MNTTPFSPDFAHDAAPDLAELRHAAAQAQPALRALKDLEMGWVAGGDGVPVWPY